MPLVLASHFDVLVEVEALPEAEQALGISHLGQASFTLRSHVVYNRPYGDVAQTSFREPIVSLTE